MSAICCTTEILVVSGDTGTFSRAAITARMSVQEKERFAALAAAKGVSVSHLAVVAIQALLDSNGLPGRPAQSPIPLREPTTNRITVRLRPGDERAIAERAARRGLRPSTYLAALLRAHLAINPPMATD